ncbi:hypothetical protein LDC_0246, partial [sediment metagenome]
MHLRDDAGRGEAPLDVLGRIRRVAVEQRVQARAELRDAADPNNTLFLHGFIDLASSLLRNPRNHLA